jgi:ParB family chromosome partitioning protein
VLQPLIVRAIAGVTATHEYEIVAGERRWRAAKLAGLRTVPVLVRELDDQSALAVALIENVQREDLNPIDQARSVAQLAAQFELTHERVGQALGRSRAWVSNLLRLLDLDDEVKELLAHGKIDVGHARAILPLDRPRQVKVARTAQRWGWSVRQVEKAVKAALSAPEESAAPKAAVDLQTRWLQRQIEAELGQRLAIRPGKDGDYTLQVDFATLAELQDVLQRLGDLVRRIREIAGPRARETPAQRAEPDQATEPS